MKYEKHKTASDRGAKGPAHHSLWRLNGALVLWSPFYYFAAAVCVCLAHCIHSYSHKWHITVATSHLLFTGMSFVSSVGLYFYYLLSAPSLGASVLHITNNLFRGFIWRTWWIIMVEQLAGNREIWFKAKFESFSYFRQARAVLDGWCVILKDSVQLTTL